MQAVTPQLLRDWPLPDPGDSKDDRGTALIVGGGRRSPGAVILAGEAALRAGCGRITLATGESSALAISTVVPEAGVTFLKEDSGGHIEGASIRSAQADMQGATAILVGPGLDDIDQTTELLHRMMRGASSSIALVWDAYAIGALARDPTLGEPAGGRLILTPNKAEAALLLGRELGDLDHDVLEVARRYQAVVSCYGIVAEPGGESWKIAGAGAGLGTAGSGDVLAGITVGLAARGAELSQAAVWATRAHTRAGNGAAAQFGPINYLARDLLPHVGPELN